jgi:ribosomal protein S18 acetylase RimI-like enzyme
MGRGDALISIRDGRPADHEALAALWRLMDELHARLVPDYFRRPTPSTRTRANLERIVNSPDEVVRVAELDGKVVGLCHLILYDTPPLAWVTPARRAHIDSLVVDAGARRRGIGRRLVEDGVSWARGRHADEVVLTVWAGNDEADRFYAALGFRPVNSVLGRRT